MSAGPSETRPPHRLLCTHPNCCGNARSMSVPTFYEHLAYHVKDDQQAMTLFEFSCTQCKAHFLTRQFAGFHAKEKRHSVAHRRDDINDPVFQKELERVSTTFQSYMAKYMKNAEVHVPSPQPVPPPAPVSECGQYRPLDSSTNNACSSFFGNPDFTSNQQYSIASTRERSTPSAGRSPAYIPSTPYVVERNTLSPDGNDAPWCNAVDETNTNFVHNFPKSNRSDERRDQHHSFDSSRTFSSKYSREGENSRFDQNRNIDRSWSDGRSFEGNMRSRTSSYSSGRGRYESSYSGRREDSGVSNTRGRFRGGYRGFNRGRGSYESNRGNFKRSREESFGSSPSRRASRTASHSKSRSPSPKKKNDERSRRARSYSKSDSD